MAAGSACSINNLRRHWQRGRYAQKQQISIGSAECESLVEFDSGCGAVQLDADAAVRFGIRQEGSSGTLYQIRQRYYDAATARFLSKEPFWPDTMDPLQLNPYQYALMSPVHSRDITGTYYQQINQNAAIQLTGAMNWGPMDTSGMSSADAAQINEIQAQFDRMEEKRMELTNAIQRMGDLYNQAARGEHDSKVFRRQMADLAEISNIGSELFNVLSKVIPGAGKLLTALQASFGLINSIAEDAQNNAEMNQSDWKATMERLKGAINKLIPQQVDLGNEQWFLWQKMLRFRRLARERFQNDDDPDFGRGSGDDSGGQTVYDGGYEYENTWGDGNQAWWKWWN